MISVIVIDSDVCRWISVAHLVANDLMLDIILSGTFASFNASNSHLCDIESNALR